MFAISRSGQYYLGSLADMGNIKIDKQCDMLEESRKAEQEAE